MTKDAGAAASRSTFKNQLQLASLAMKKPVELVVLPVLFLGALIALSVSLIVYASNSYASLERARVQTLADTYIFSLTSALAGALAPMCKCFFSTGLDAVFGSPNVTHPPCPPPSDTIQSLIVSAPGQALHSNVIAYWEDAVAGLVNSSSAIGALEVMPYGWVSAVYPYEVQQLNLSGVIISGGLL